MAKTRLLATIKLNALLACVAFAAAQSGLTMMQGGGDLLDLTRLTPVYEERFDGARAPEEIFSGYLTLGQQGVWVGHLEDHSYVLSNTEDDTWVQSIALFEIDEVQSPLSSGGVSVEVSGHFDRMPGAGLVVRYQPDTGYYYGFGLTGGDAYAVYKLDAEGLYTVMSGTSTAIDPAATNRLAATSENAMMNFYINEEFIGAIGDDQFPDGGVGILAAGTGSFRFSNFVIYAAPAPHQGASSLPPEEPSWADGGAPPDGFSPPEVFQGRFRGDQLILELTMLDSRSYSGHLNFQGQTFPVRATLGFGWTIGGHFESGGAQFTFGALLDGEVLTFRTGGSSYQLFKENP